MKAFGLINMGVLPLLLEAMAPAYAQRDQHQRDDKYPKQEQEAKPDKQHGSGPEPRKQGKGQQWKQRPPQPQAEPQQQRPAKARQEQQRQPQRHELATPPSGQKEPRGQGEQRAVWQEHRARNWQSEHRTWQQRGGYNGYRIPEGRYRGQFGPEHVFRIHSYPLAVFGGYPRFQFGGFWFSVVDRWPEYWSDRWYDDDDVYIDFAGDGYYLYNRRHPGDRISISVHLN